jgi:hypothetical protein
MPAVRRGASSGKLLLFVVFLSLPGSPAVACDPDPWRPPAMAAVYTGWLRPRHQWIEDLPTFDIHMAWREPVWQANDPRWRTTVVEPLLTPDEFLELFAALPTFDDLDRAPRAIVERMNRWAAAHRSIAGREPARTILAQLRRSVAGSQTLTAVQVYGALLEQRYHGTPASVMSVKDLTVAMPTLSGSSSEWLKQFDGVPLALRRAASQQSPTKPKVLQASQLPPGTRLVSARAVDAVFTRGIEENWAAFRRQFKTQGWLSFSEVIFGADGLDALVYYEARCGGLCGEGGFAWLHRDTLRSPWSVAKRIISWES